MIYFLHVLLVGTQSRGDVVRRMLERETELAQLSHEWSDLLARTLAENQQAVELSQLPVERACLVWFCQFPLTSAVLEA